MIRIASASVTTAMAVPLSGSFVPQTRERPAGAPPRATTRAAPVQPSFNGQRLRGFRRVYLPDARETDILRGYLARCTHGHTIV